MISATLPFTSIFSLAERASMPFDVHTGCTTFSPSFSALKVSFPTVYSPCCHFYLFCAASMTDCEF